MEVRNKQIPTTLRLLLFLLLAVCPAFASTYQHYLQQVRRTDGSVMAGAQVRIYSPGTNTPVTIFSNITGTTVKSQPILSDSNGYFDFFLGDSVVDILIQGSNFPTTKLQNVTLSALATAGVLTVGNGGTGANSFLLNTVLLGNNALPIKVSSVGLANQVFRVPSAGGQPDFGAINLASSAAVSGVLPPANGGTGSTNGSVLRIREQDGTPNVPNVVEVRVTDSTLTDIGGGVVSLATGAGGGSGWTDDGTVVRLTTATDVVSIGTSTPPAVAPLHVQGPGLSASDSLANIVSTGAFGAGLALDSTAATGHRWGLVSSHTSNCTGVAGQLHLVDVTSGGCAIRTLWDNNGKVTIGSQATTSLFNVGTAQQFQVDSSGDVVKLKNLTYSWPSSHVLAPLVNDGAGNLSWGGVAGSGVGVPGGANTNVQFNDSGVFGGEAAFVYDKTNNFVGIGSTAALTDEGLSVATTGTHNGVISSQRADATAPPGNSAGFRAYKSRGSVGTPTATQSGDWMLGLSSNSHDGTGFFGTARAYTEATQTHTNTAHGSRWVFSTTPDGSTTITDTFRLPQDGGLQILTGTKPTCDSTKRGYLFRVDGGAGVADTYEACDKDAADAYAWRNIHPTGTSSDASLFDPGKMQLIRNYAKTGATSLDINDGEPSGLSVIGNASVSDGTSGRWVIQTTTAATTGLRAGFEATQTLPKMSWANQVGNTAGEIAFRILIEPSNAITNMRHWTGLSQEDTFDEATSTPAANYAWFRYATDVDGTAFWRTCTDDGGGAPTCNTTSIAVAVNTAYRFRIRWAGDGSYIKFYSDDVLLFTHTTNLPSTTALNRWISVTKTLANEAKTLGINWVQWWY